MSGIQGYNLGDRPAGRLLAWAVPAWAGCPRFCLRTLSRKGGEMASTESIRDLAEPVLASAGLELWDVEITARRGQGDGRPTRRSRPRCPLCGQRSAVTAARLPSGGHPGQPLPAGGVEPGHRAHVAHPCAVSPLYELRDHGQDGESGRGRPATPGPPDRCQPQGDRPRTGRLTRAPASKSITTRSSGPAPSWCGARPQGRPGGRRRGPSRSATGRAAPALNPKDTPT